MVDGVKCSFCNVLRPNTLVTGYQATVSVKVICEPTSIDSFTRRSMYPDTNELAVIPCLGTIVCHCWPLMLSQAYVSLAFFASRFDSSSTLSYTYFTALIHEIQYMLGTFRSNSPLADLNICTAFLSGIRINILVGFFWERNSRIWDSVILQYDTMLPGEWFRTSE
jgi:hypothetical protein